MHCQAPTGISNSKLSALGAWTPLAVPYPSVREEMAAAYDAKDGYAVLFGGYGHGGALLGDTWRYSGGLWTNITGTTHPSPRYDTAMAFDAKDGYVVLFGGSNVSATFSDTWKFSAGKWTHLTPTVHPSARYAAGMAYDAADGELVLFGGFTAALGALGDTWAFKAGAWTNLSLAHAPSPRATADGLATYGPTGGVLVFGGFSFAAGTPHDTWVFKNKTWTALHPATAPSGRYAPAMTYDTTDGKVAFFGGYNSTIGSDLSDTWSFANGNWTKLGPAFHPSSRTGTATTDGPAGAGILVFGGYSYQSNSQLNDSWTFKGSVWKKATPPAPSARDGASMVYDESDGYVLLYGASGVSGLGHETWTFVAGHWKQLHPKLSPPDRQYAMMAYDAADGYVVLFGGATLNSALNDTWTFSAGIWTLDATPVAPAPRFYGMMTYDATDGYVLLFGGETVSYVPYGDTWSFSSGAWTHLSPSTSPQPRASAGMTYDSEDGYVLLFGGANNLLPVLYNDTWSFSGGNWTYVSSAANTVFVTLLGPGLADDTYDGYPVLFGGYNTTRGFSPYTFAYLGGTWVSVGLTTTFYPAGRLVAGQMVYDAADTTILLFGGETGFTQAASDTWEFN